MHWRITYLNVYIHIPISAYFTWETRRQELNESLDVALQKRQELIQHLGPPRHPGSVFTNKKTCERGDLIVISWDLLTNYISVGS